jgi:hypothetical protein
MVEHTHDDQRERERARQTQQHGSCHRLSVAPRRAAMGTTVGVLLSTATLLLYMTTHAEASSNLNQANSNNIGSHSVGLRRMATGDSESSVS